MNEFDSGDISLDSTMDTASDSNTVDAEIEADDSVSEVDDIEDSIPEVSEEEDASVLDIPEDEEPGDSVSEVLEEDVSSVLDTPEEEQPDDSAPEVLEEDVSSVLDTPEEEQLDDSASEALEEDVSSILDAPEDEQFDMEMKNEPNARVKYFGQKYRTDDNGDLYMKYNNEKKDWELLPDTKYEVKGYYYETDKNASITRGGGTMHESAEGRKALNDSVEGMKEGDERGHLIGDQFGASNKKGNLFPQSKSINRGEFKEFEMAVADLVHEGHDVQIVIDPVYADDSKRPDSLDAHLNIDGYLIDESISNEPDSPSLGEIADKE